MRNKRVKNIKKQMVRFTVGLFLFISIANYSYSQQAGEIGVHLGATYYLGDINWTKHFYSPRINYGAFYKQHFNPRLIVKFAGLHTHIQASDKDSRFKYQNLRDYEFVTSLNELSAQVEFNFLVYEIGELKKNNFTPYVNLGIAVSHTPDSEEKVATAIPMGAGIKVNITRRIVLGAEWAFRKSFSDMLDNVTGEDLNFYLNNNVPVDEAGILKQRGFMTNDDWYSYAGLTLSYAFRIGDNKCYAYY